MSTRHHTADYGEDGHKTCAEAIAALDAELATLPRDCTVAPMCWSIEIDHVAEGHPRRRQQVPDLADRLVELLQARPELAWEVSKRVEVAGPWTERGAGDWVRSSSETVGWYGAVYPAAAGAWNWRGVPYATLRDAQAAVDAHLTARGVALVGGAVVLE